MFSCDGHLWSEDNGDHTESENNDSSEDEVSEHEIRTPPPPYNNTNDKADK
jgi:hypothetical protein